mgnify:CR=1 FL=1
MTVLGGGEIWTKTSAPGQTAESGSVWKRRKPMKIKVMIVDDQVILSEGIKTVLATDEELDVIAVASDGVEALEKMEKEVPDVVLLDIRMPNMNGVVTTGEIKKRYPGVKVIMLTTFDDSDYI